MGGMMTCNAGCGLERGHEGACGNRNADWRSGFDSDLLTEKELAVLQRQCVGGGYLTQQRDVQRVNVMYLFGEICRLRRQLALASRKLAARKAGRSR